VWSLVPLVIAIAISFNASRSNSVLHGFSLQWWWSDPVDSLWHDPELHAALFQSLRLSLLTVALAVPLGVAFAIAIDRWHGRPATGFSFLMLLSFVMPEIVLGISLFLVFQFLLTFVELGTTAQVLGLVTYQLSYPVIIVRARLLTIGRSYEEAASDLGAPPRQAIRRVLLPLLYPAIFASAAIVFADSIDDFVTVRYLSGPASSEPLSVKIYNFTRAEPTPAVNAAATFLLVTTTVAVLLGYLAYRHATKGQRAASVSDFASV
jgi:spermidine/putrescine transport system permease protein